MAVKKKKVTRKNRKLGEGTPIGELFEISDEEVDPRDAADELSYDDGGPEEPTPQLAQTKPLTNPEPDVPVKETPLDDPGVMWVDIRLPVSPYYDKHGNFRKVTHIELNNFKYKSGAAAFALYNGLRDINAEIDPESRRPVSQFSHMAMYIFDQVFKEMEKALPKKNTK